MFWDSVTVIFPHEFVTTKQILTHSGQGGIFLKKSETERHSNKMAPSAG